MFLLNIKVIQMREVKTIQVSSKGQIVIPYRIRRQLNIGPRTYLRIMERKGDIVIKPVVMLSELRGRFKGVTTADIRKMREEDIKLESK